MKMKLFEIQINAKNIASIAKKRLPYDMAKAIKKNIIALQEEIKLIEETRIKIAEEHSEKDELGNPVIKDNCYSLSDDGENLFKKEYGEFLETETDVEICTINEEVMGLLRNEKYDALTPEELMKLDFMIEK